MKVNIIPKSKRAKNKFANQMGANGECLVEQDKVNKYFLVSTVNKDAFWVLKHNDPNWDVSEIIMEI